MRRTTWLMGKKCHRRGGGAKGQRTQTTWLFHRNVRLHGDRSHPYKQKSLNSRAHQPARLPIWASEAPHQALSFYHKGNSIASKRRSLLSSPLLLTNHRHHLAEHHRVSSKPAPCQTLCPPPDDFSYFPLQSEAHQGPQRRPSTTRPRAPLLPPPS